MYARLGSTTVAAGFPRGRQPEFPTGKIPLGQYSCQKKTKKTLIYHMDYRIFNNACNCTVGCTDTIRVCAESWPWEKNPWQHQGIESAPAACLSDALPSEPHTQLEWAVKTNKFWEELKWVSMSVILSLAYAASFLWLFVVFDFFSITFHPDTTYNYSTRWPGVKNTYYFVCRKMHSW